MLRAALYARVSTNDQQTLPMQSRAMREYAVRRGWTVAMEVREVGSGAAQREAREELLDAVWGPDIHVEPRTVDVHIRRLRKSVNGEGELDLVRTVRAAGYALDTEPV